MNLESLGACAAVRDAFSRYAAADMVLGRIAVSQRDRYLIHTEAGEVDGEPSGGLWFRAEDAAAMPAVGDWVAARIAAPNHAIVEAVLPRRTLFARRAVGKREAVQPIAANIDVVFLVCGLDGDFNLRRLERYLALGVEAGVDPVVVLNKADLCTDLSGRIAEAKAVAGVAPVIAISAFASIPGEGADALQNYLGPGITAALLGSSGAGKSTIANHLLGTERLRTSAVRESDSRGRHTTTHRELAVLPGGGALIDTPGMRELQLWASEDSVLAAFEDIAALAEDCRFGDCGHSTEPGCSVRDALEAGELSANRWQSYRKLTGEARRHEELTNVQAAQKRKSWIKKIHRAQRQLYKSRG